MPDPAAAYEPSIGQLDHNLETAGVSEAASMKTHFSITRSGISGLAAPTP